MGFSLRSQKETKATNIQKPKKTLSFFGFSQFLNHQFIQKTKKTWVFSVCSRSKPKKNQKTQGKPKKTKHEPQTKHSLKSFGFLVFWFSRSFFDFVNRVPQRVSKYCFLLVFSQGFLIFWVFPLDSLQNSC